MRTLRKICEEPPKAEHWRCSRCDHDTLKTLWIENDKLCPYCANSCVFTEVYGTDHSKMVTEIKEAVLVELPEEDRTAPYCGWDAGVKTGKDEMAYVIRRKIEEME